MQNSDNNNDFCQTGNGDIKNMTGEEAKGMVLILALLQIGEKEREARQLWKEFEKEMQSNNRYFPQEFDEIKKTFLKYSDEATIFLHKNDILYRARRADDELLDCTINRIKTIIDSEKKSNEIYLTYEAEHLAQIINNLSGETKVLFSKEDFWGFDAINSDAPTVNIPNGRINPSGIRYLYAAEDIQTAIIEVRPYIKQYVSVANIKILKEMKLYDISKIIPKNNEDIFMEHFYVEILKQFSVPNYDETHKYYATQYISEMLKHEGFQGLQFNSSLHEGGKNIVLFDTQTGNNYEIINSSVHKVEAITLNQQQILPVKGDSE